MIHYSISVKSAATQYLKIDMVFEVEGNGPVELCLPAWRPGRYELCSFAAQVKDVECRDASGQSLAIKKIRKDAWLLQPGEARRLHVSYLYHAATLNAGSTFVNEHQLYVNPINCLMFLSGRLEEPCELRLQISEHWRVATALKEREKHVFRARHYHELADSPLIASGNLKGSYFEVAGIRFDLWFQGECKPDMNRLRRDLSLIIRQHLEFFKTFPTDRYHFLCQMVPYPFRHGVEHTASTVIAFGPSYALMDEGPYEDFLNLCSHEFFHVWNVKTIRPADMLPYDYTRENYSELGYVYEGFTTYYGPLLGLRAGVFSETFFLRNLEEWIIRHAHNYGRRSSSVAHSSFDTWLDGYREGAPHRKVSIYNEGALLALGLDFIIRRHSDGARSLDDLMRALNREFGELRGGYTRNDLKRLAESIAGTDLTEFFERYVEGTASYLHFLEPLLPLAGLNLRTEENPLVSERDFGFKTSCQGGRTLVSITAPGSIAELAGLMIGDEIVAINGYRVDGNLNEWLRYFSDERVDLHVMSGHNLRKISLVRGPDTFYPLYRVVKTERPTAEQVKFYENWTGTSF
ncbi:MAG: PDZ domain-containing protein [Flavobacteriales bacterium]|nr:PDZ domain-containing protein [Flavobacteriales bacterium]